jgi:hypothetical protein
MRLPNWKTIHYFPAEKIDMSTSGRIVEQTERDTLGISIYTPEHRQALFRMYAPLWEIQHQGDYDRIGTPYLKDNRQSMFGQDSIAPGSKKLERFILWPTGVLSPGAIRQWGRHAVAFAGKRHFDDPFFMDRMFVESEPRKSYPKSIGT